MNMTNHASTRSVDADDAVPAMTLEQIQRREAIAKVNKAVAEAMKAAAEAETARAEANAAASRLDNESWKMRTEILKNVSYVAYSGIGIWIAFMSFRLKADQK